jgi:hypothetical protein
MALRLSPRWAARRSKALPGMGRKRARPSGLRDGQVGDHGSHGSYRTSRDRSGPSPQSDTGVAVRRMWRQFEESSFEVTEQERRIGHE